MRYEEVNGFVDFVGQVVSKGEGVIVADPCSCSKEGTPLKYGIVDFILHRKQGSREYWKIQVKITRSGQHEPYIVQVLTPKRLIGA